MAEYNVRINAKTSTGYDQLYPESKSNIINFNNENSDLLSTNVEDVIKEINLKSNQNIENIGELTSLDTESKENLVDALNEINKKIYYITPQMFGAKGDGITDDTIAFQNAIDTGKNVFVPLSRGERYIISETLNIHNGHQSIFGDLSAGETAMETDTVIGSILVKSETFINSTFNSPKFSNLCIMPYNYYANGTIGEGSICFNLSGVNGNLEAEIINCYISGFSYVINSFGRSVRVVNNVFRNDSDVLTASYDYAGSDYTSLENGFRGIIFINNRCHAISKAIVLNNDYINGLEVSNNVLDIGKTLLDANGHIITSMLINGNVVEHSDTSPIAFPNVTVNNAIITDNVFRNSDIRESFYAISGSQSTLNNCIISNNIFKKFTGNAINLGDVNNSIISGNTIAEYSTRGTNTDASIKFTKLNQCSIIGNSITVPEATDSAIAGYGGESSVTNTQIIGNSVNKQMISLYKDDGNNNIQN